MKRIIKISVVTIIALFGLLMLNSCSKDEEVKDDVVDLPLYTGENVDEDAIANDVFGSGQSDLKCSGGYPEICGDVNFYPLIASQRYYAGALLVYNDNENLYVTYWSMWLRMSDFHLYVGSQEALPVNGGNNPVPGKFPYKDAGSAYVKTFTIPLSSLTTDECLTIAAHTTYGRHTIWAKSDLTFSDVYGSKRWGWVVENCIDVCEEETEDLLTAKVFLIDTATSQSFWSTIQTDDKEEDNCIVISLVPAIDDQVYELYNSGNVVGTVSTDINGNLMTVTIQGTEGLLLRKSYLFYGTQEEYDANYNEDGCQMTTAWEYVESSWSRPKLQYVIEVDVEE